MTRELAKIRASLVSISDHVTPLTTAAHNMLRFVGDAEDHGYWDNEMISAQAQARLLRRYAQKVLAAAEAVEQTARSP